LFHKRLPTQTDPIVDLSRTHDISSKKRLACLRNLINAVNVAGGHWEHLPSIISWFLPDDHILLGLSWDHVQPKQRHKLEMLLRSITRHSETNNQQKIKCLTVSKHTVRHKTNFSRFYLFYQLFNTSTRVILLRVSI